MALRRGATVTAIANSGAADRLSALGVNQVLRRDLGTDFAGSFDVIIDPVGGLDTPEFVGKLSPNGRYMLNGAAGGFPPADFGMALLQTFFGSPSFSMFSLNSVQASELVVAGQSIFNDVLQGVLIPQVSDAFSLADAAKAHSALESGKRFGKIVLRP
ncbi:zinc-binding dehydrogenase [Devosia sp. RR2S18]|uniref:zinc-binding dehydrogenase n=1 Tax=Devosia rhizosphaerae TaxID=3049774 RepID=UPI00254090A2|nr:zinc-binding dehydrogenase [Devosia sp. RR2S18]WIJ26389.1 zinc-binding dehydrogenase [Devosia sp. RR2S18]